MLTLLLILLVVWGVESEQSSDIAFIGVFNRLIDEGISNVYFSQVYRNGTCSDIYTAFTNVSAAWYDFMFVIAEREHGATGRATAIWTSNGHYQTTIWRFDLRTQELKSIEGTQSVKQLLWWTDQTSGREGVLALTCGNLGTSIYYIDPSGDKGMERLMGVDNLGCMDGVSMTLMPDNRAYVVIPMSFFAIVDLNTKTNIPGPNNQGLYDWFCEEEILSVGPHARNGSTITYLASYLFQNSVGTLTTTGKSWDENGCAAGWTGPEDLICDGIVGWPWAVWRDDKPELTILCDPEGSFYQLNTDTYQYSKLTINQADSKEWTVFRGNWGGVDYYEI